LTLVKAEHPKKNLANEFIPDKSGIPLTVDNVKLVQPKKYHYYL
jgi:hypothetical protein